MICNGIIHFFAGAEDIKDSTLDRTTSRASKAFNESRPRRLHRPRHLMSLALPLFHANTRGGNILTRDTICATYTVAAVSAFFDRRRVTCLITLVCVVCFF